MAGATPPVKLEDEVLRKFYRSFHKHGAPYWAKMSKDTKLSAEQCEMLHKQHMSFLSLPASPALETAFLALVDDHYNAAQGLVKDEVQEEDVARGGRPRRGEMEEAEAQVATSGSQKPRRTPKPTPQRLAAEEEQQARRLAKANQGTPKSARSKMMAKVPPSPPHGEWTSSQRKRSRRLFEDGGEQDLPRYRSPVLDRWRGRHNTDVDEGVDALLSLASGAHAASAIEDHPAGTDVASNTADPDYDAPEHDAPDTLQDTPPKKPRGPRGARATPTPSGTPVKGGARSSSAAAATADGAPAASAAGMRSPRARVGSSATAAAAAAPAAPTVTTSGRAGAVSGVKPKKEKEARGSPSSSQQRGAGSAGHAQPTAEASGEAGPSGPESNEAATADVNDAATPNAAAAPALPTSPGPSGRPVRKRKPTAIALAAAAAAEEEDGGGSRGVRSVVAAVAAAVAAAEATQAATVAAAAAAAAPASEPGTASPPSDDIGGSNHTSDMTTNTAALLASVPPVRTRGTARLTSSGPGSRRAGEPGATRPAEAAAATGETTAKEGSVEPRVADEAAPGPGPSAEAPAVAPSSARPKAPGQSAGQGAAPTSVRLGPARVATQPPPGRTRRRKSLPERLPPMWESFRVALPQAGPGSGAAAVAAAGDGILAAADAAAAAASTSISSAAAAGATAPALRAAEVALRHCLGPRVRRWCMYEFMYSALDRPWFLRNELLEFCALHMQLPTTKLTRLEWSVLRSALGRPRRLSLAFLREERLRLEGYREHSRLKYEEVTLGMEVPNELPRQLRVGQEVTARHPFSRQLHDGVILTVKGNKYRVQFHRGDLMTEVIRDTDVMPVDPHECLPLHMAVVPFMLNGRPYDPVRLAGVRGLVPPPGMTLRPPTLPARPLGSYATALDTQMMREQDAAMVAEVQRALEVKEDLVAQLTQLNNEAASGLHTDENGGRTDNFQLKYTNVVLRLRDTNTVLEAALTRLQSRQQQITAAAVPAAFGPALPLQQQQQLAAVAGNTAVAAGVTSAAGNGLKPCDVAGGLLVLPSQQQQQQSQSQGLTPPQPPAGPMPALPQPGSQTPPAQAPQQPPPLLASAPSPTTSGAAGASLSAPPAAAAAPAAAGPPAAGSQGRQAAAKPTTQVQPPSPGAPLVVPPPQPSSTAASTAQLHSSTATPATALPSFPLPAQGPLSLGIGPPISSPEQLVDQALAEARTVVDRSRGKPANGQSFLLPAGPQSLPAVAPIILAPGGASVPLVLPLGAVLPQQLVLPPGAGTCADGQLQDQAQQLAPVPSSHVLAVVDGGAGSGGSEGRIQDVSAFAGCSTGGVGRDASVDPLEPSGSVSVCVKTEEENSHGRHGSEVVGAASDRAAEATTSGCPPSLAEQQHLTEEELAESWLRDVIVGCVGVLFTIQKCTAGNVPAVTVGEALDLAVQQLRIRTDGENDALYADIVQSVQGLKGHLRRAFA